MEHFVTLFDKLYLPQGLALHMSMMRCFSSFKLWILCVDDETFAALEKLNLANVCLLKLSDLETEDLLRAKSERSKVEYCWTLTPFAPKFVFDRDRSINRVTYLDADLWFLRDATPLFGELDSTGKSVMITEQAFAHEFDQTLSSGRFCVQFITFARNSSEPVRNDWQERCLEWCYAKGDGQRLGDQKYLDEWPQTFPEEVYILENKELCIAPWNATRFPFGNAVFFHFHGLKIINKNRASFGSYPIPYPVLQNVYKPYLSDLKAAMTEIESLGMKIEPQISLWQANFAYLIKLGYFIKILFSRVGPSSTRF